MPTKIFLTGATGYIGGDVLYALLSSPLAPSLHISALIRTPERAAAVTKAHPAVRPVLGTLDDAALLTAEAAAADIVLHTADASDHEPAARAIAAGLVAGHSPDRPGFWLHTGGAGILTYFDTADGKLGAPPTRHFDDWDGVRELTNLPDEAFHRNVDRIVLETGTKHADAVKTALLCPPTIYGPGRGPLATRSRQAYELAALVLREGYAPVVGAGQALWNSVHVHDLAALFLLLVAAATSAPPNLSPEIWGANAYFLVENGEFVWADLARRMAAQAAEMGYIEEGGGERTLSYDEAYAVADFQAVSWGLNSRGRAERARRTLGWMPVGNSIWEEIPAILRAERERLGRK